MPVLYFTDTVVTVTVESSLNVVCFITLYSVLTIYDCHTLLYILLPNRQTNLFAFLRVQISMI